MKKSQPMFLKLSVGVSLAAAAVTAGVRAAPETVPASPPPATPSGGIGLLPGGPDRVTVPIALPPGNRDGSGAQRTTIGQPAGFVELPVVSPDVFGSGTDGADPADGDAPLVMPVTAGEPVAAERSVGRPRVHRFESSSHASKIATPIFDSTEADHDRGGSGKHAVSSQETHPATTRMGRARDAARATRHPAQAESSAHDVAGDVVAPSPRTGGRHAHTSGRHLWAA